MTAPEDPPPPRTYTPQERGLSLARGWPAPGRVALVAVCVAAAGLGAGLASELAPAPRRALFILLLATALWVTDALPAFAVGLLVIGLQVSLLGDPDGPVAEHPRDWERFAAVLGNPLIWLFLGGFVLAEGMRKSQLDRWLAGRVLSRVGSRPPRVLLGVMGLTFALSMFLSNTASTAMVLAMVAPVVASLDAEDPYGASLLLGVAVAANLGGMASLLGTPPNAIAVGALAEYGGTHVSFLGWMLLGLPLSLGLLVLAWALLSRLYRPRVVAVVIAHRAWDEPGAVPTLWEVLVVSGTLLLTVGMWLTSGWHGVPTAAVSLLPIVLLTSSGVLEARDLRGLPYDVLFLIAGGLALGETVVRTGLSDVIVDALPTGDLGLTGMALALSYLTLLLSNVMSNTAAANVLVPIGVTLAGAGAPQVAIPVAMAASAAMALPIATPPNALVHATGRLGTRSFLAVGGVIGVLTPVLAVFWTRLALDWVLRAG